MRSTVRIAIQKAVAKLQSGHFSGLNTATRVYENREDSVWVGADNVRGTYEFCPANYVGVSRSTWGLGTPYDSKPR